MSIIQKWDEIQSVRQTPFCECGAFKSCSYVFLKRVVDEDYVDKVMQFLMGLNDTFENIRSQILATDHLPNVNKVLVQQVEKQKVIIGERNDSSEMSTMSIGRHQVGNQKNLAQNSTDQKFNGQYKRMDYMGYKRQKMDENVTIAKVKVLLWILALSCMVI